MEDEEQAVFDLKKPSKWWRTRVEKAEKKFAKAQKAYNLVKKNEDDLAKACKRYMQKHGFGTINREEDGKVMADVQTAPK